LKIKPFLIFLTLAAYAFSACTDRPSNVLSDKQMEDVLYDLYLAEVEINENRSIFNNDSTAKQKLLNSVFEKHKITEQKFDTSLVWYNGNIDKYLKVNNKVGERFSALASKLENNLNKMEAEIRKAQIHNLFPDTTSFFLQSPGLFQNRYVFKTDSVQLRTIQSFELAFNVLGIRDSIYPVLSFCLQTNDTVFVNCDTIRSNGVYSHIFSVPSGQTVKEIYGYFAIPYDEKNLILFNDITLFKGGDSPDKPVDNVSFKREDLTPVKREGFTIKQNK
jgi:hypothetical protein